MTKNQAQKKQIARIKKFALKWKWIVTELGWNFDMHYADNYLDMPKGVEEKSNAVVYADFDYLKAHIYFNLDNVAMLNEHELEEVVVHELTHMLTRPLLESNEMEEYTVTTIARILMRMKSCLETED